MFIFMFQIGSKFSEERGKRKNAAEISYHRQYSPLQVLKGLTVKVNYNY